MAAPYSLSGYARTVGATCKFTLRQLAAQEKIWNGSAFETYAVANIATYGITATIAGSGSLLRLGNVPTTTAGLYIAELWELAGGSLALTDDLCGAPVIINWDGTDIASVTNSVVNGDFTYSPVDEETTSQFGEIVRGSGIKIRFTAVPATAVDGDYFEARLQYGPARTNYYKYTVAAGNLEVDEATGVILVNPTATQTDSLPLDIPIKCELWRIGSGDDNTTRVAKVKFKVDDSLRGA